jgi:hypothetical protein
MNGWRWRTGGPLPPIEASVFAAELERLAGEDPIELVEPDRVWQAARKRSSPIHGCFDWDIERAAEAHWRDHARALVGRLQLVRVDVENAVPTSTRGWWSVQIERRRGYMHEDRVMGDADLRMQTIARAKGELHSFLAKYLGILSTFGRAVPRLQEVLGEIQDEIDRLELEATSRRPRRGPEPPEDRPTA